MSQSDLDHYMSIRRMIDKLNDESFRVLRRNDLIQAASKGSNGVHRWYLFSSIELNSREVNIINMMGAKVVKINHIPIIGLYIITMEPGDGIIENESEDESEDEFEVSNSSSSESGSEVSEELDEVANLDEERGNEDPK